MEANRYLETEYFNGKILLKETVLIKGENFVLNVFEEWNQMDALDKVREEIRHLKNILDALEGHDVL